MGARQEEASGTNVIITVRGGYMPPSAFQATWQFNMLSELTALCGLFNRSLSCLTALGGSGSKGKGAKT